MSDTRSEGRYQPFKGLSAWFSSSVHPDLIKQWDYCGGIFADESSADFLFSENALAEDTRRVHCEQREVAVLQPEWIAEVTHFQKSAREVAVGPFLLLPVCCDPVAPEENCGGLRTPETVPLAHPPPLVRESRLETGFGPVVPELVEEEEKEEEEEVRVQEEVGEILDSGVTTVMFDQGGCVLGQVHILQLEPSSALHIDCLEPVHTRIIDFKCNRNGHTVHKRPVSQAH